MMSRSTAGGASSRVPRLFGSISGANSRAAHEDGDPWNKRRRKWMVVLISLLCERVLGPLEGPEGLRTFDHRGHPRSAVQRRPPVSECISSAADCAVGQTYLA